jgi:hypothetical protein
VTLQAAPSWYEPVIPTVRAVVFNDLRSSSRILDWLRQLSRAAELTSEATQAGLLVLEQVDGSRRETLLRIGDMAVESASSRYGWDACPARSFRRCFTLRPRELPIFETNDTAE